MKSLIPADSPDWLTAGWAIDALAEASASFDVTALTLLPATGGGEFASAVLRMHLDDGGSVVAKISRRVDGRSPSAYNFWERERLFYESDWPQRLPVGLAAPQLLASASKPEASVVVLEDVGRIEPASRDLGFYLDLAANLGQFNGHVDPNSEQVPAWFCCDFLAEEQIQLDPRTEASNDGSTKADSPTGTTPKLPTSTVATLLDSLAHLPSGPAHMDAFSRNVTKRGDTIILFDWSQLGVAPIGAELGGLFWLTVGFLDCPTHHLEDFRTVLLESYLDGLLSQTNRASREQVSAAYEASIVLRHRAMMMSVGPLLDKLDPVIAAVIGQPLSKIAESWTQATQYVDTLQPPS